MTLSQRMRVWIGQEVKVAVERKKGKEAETVELTVTPVDRFQYIPNFGPGSLVALEPIVIAFSVENKVVGVEPDTPAEQAGTWSTFFRGSP